MTVSNLSPETPTAAHETPTPAHEPPSSISDSTILISDLSGDELKLDSKNITAENDAYVDLWKLKKEISKCLIDQMEEVRLKQARLVPEEPACLEKEDVPVVSSHEKERGRADHVHNLQKLEQHCQGFDESHIAREEESYDENYQKKMLTELWRFEIIFNDEVFDLSSEENTGPLSMKAIMSEENQLQYAIKAFPKKIIRGVKELTRILDSGEEGEFVYVGKFHPKVLSLFETNSSVKRNQFLIGISVGNIERRPIGYDYAKDYPKLSPYFEEFKNTLAKVMTPIHGEINTCSLKYFHFDTITCGYEHFEWAKSICVNAAKVNKNISMTIGNSRVDRILVHKRPYWSRLLGENIKEYTGDGNLYWNDYDSRGSYNDEDGEYFG